MLHARTFHRKLLSVHNRKLITIHAHNSVRRRKKLHRCAILSPSESPWQRLYYHGDISSSLLMTGLTRRAFHLLLKTLFTDNNLQSVLHRRGRPDLIDPVAQLGLYLLYWIHHGTQAPLLDLWCDTQLMQWSNKQHDQAGYMMVNNIVAYGPDGKVFLCTINFPGSWHEQQIFCLIFTMTLGITKCGLIRVSLKAVMLMQWML
jgi:hypothetical protein